ncbi:hypothetical protein IL252_08485 [Halomicrobium sp. IBSBa]|uniref:DUF5789 family protein n=1 Tax=Halomicrobium sp. IBSBa TaxID=2778916 RepID=UPI001ABF5141|nr:hypothetical protein [Halomicrobium sp. IBSBa]MBO4247849.1 hypothetical protein [Halomicrobium sp. IBSBa]
MADNKSGRDDQADNADRRQRERDILTALERNDETEPPVDERALGELETELDTLSFPVTAREVVETLGDRTVESDAGVHTVADLLPETDQETFDEPATVRTRVQRPTIAAAMKRIVEHCQSIQQTSLGTSQREAYEKTFRALKAVDADDDDEGIQYVADWIVERIDETGTLPGSRAVRREAATFCRSNGYSVRNDEWLGV